MIKTPEFAEVFKVFARIGCLSFGGPAGQIALMHKELVEDRNWIGEGEYLHALNFCHLLPGPEAQQLATYIGWKLHGVRGGLAAGLLFVIPGALVILGLSILYAYAAGLGWFAALFIGVKAAVLAIVAQALMRIAGRSLDRPHKRVIAVASFVALFFFAVPFPVLIITAAVMGTVLARGDGAPVVPDGPRHSIGATIRTVAIWLTIWALPMAVVALVLGRDHELWRIGSFFSQLAVVTFGGAYAVLAYMAQEAVQGFGWLSAGEMADGLGLAETTPGPLIMVTQFVGFLAAFRAPEPFTPLVAGLIGAGVTTWVTFAPCFLWIFALAPWVDRLQNAPRLKGALGAIAAAVVGVIANLTLWFALHVVFKRVGTWEGGVMRMTMPDMASFDWRAAALTVLAFILLFVLRWRVLPMLAVMGLAGLGLVLA